MWQGQEGASQGQGPLGMQSRPEIKPGLRSGDKDKNPNSSLIPILTIAALFGLPLPYAEI